MGCDALAEDVDVPVGVFMGELEDVWAHPGFDAKLPGCGNGQVVGGRYFDVIGYAIETVGGVSVGEDGGAWRPGDSGYMTFGQVGGPAVEKEIGDRVGGEDRLIVLLDGDNRLGSMARTASYRWPRRSGMWGSRPGMSRWCRFSYLG